MDIVVELFAVLRERAGTQELRLSGLPEPLDVAGLKRELVRRHPELGPLDHVRGVLGTAYVPDHTALEPGARVFLLPPVSGGSDGAGYDPYASGVMEVTADPIDPGACQARVGHATCGAVVLFVGTTRDRNRGQDVVRLDYEAFESMAGAEMGRIFEECLERFGPVAATGGEDPEQRRLRMLCVHRTGTVAVGEPSVAIAVASPHRDAAFLAARFLIDELKARVPLWKKELYGDGHHWIGDRS